MPLYPEMPQGVLSPGFSNFDQPLRDPRVMPGPQGRIAPEPEAFDTSQIAAMTGDATPSKLKRPGFISRIKQQPGGSRALIALGAGLLSSQNFFEGLGQGAMAYQGVLDEEAAKLLPEATRDSTHTSRRDPETGQLLWERTPVADFQEGIQKSKLDAAMAQRRMQEEFTDGRFGRNIAYMSERDREQREVDRYKVDRDFDDSEAGRASALEIATLNNAAAEQRARITGAASGNKPPPAGVLNTFEEIQDKIGTAGTTLTQGQRIMAALAPGGGLELGFFRNIGNALKGQTGLLSDEESRTYGQLQQFTQQLVNTILIDANGVQTDGDAARAKIMSMVSSGDAAGARLEIANVMESIRRGRERNVARSADIAQQYGVNTSNIDRVQSRQAPARRPAARPAAPTRKPAASRPSVSNW